MLMNKIFFINRLNLAYFYSLCLYAFFLPSLNNLTVPLLIFISILTILDFSSIKRFWSINKNNLEVLALPVIFLLNGLSLFYSLDLGTGTKYLTRSLPLLLIPIVLFKASDLSYKQINTIFKLFVIGCVLTVFYSYSYVIYEAIDGGYKKLHLPENHLKYFLNRITYHDLVSKNIVDNSIYFASYILFAIIILKSRKELFSTKIRNSILVLFLVTFILLTPLIIAISGLIIFSLNFVIKNRSEITNRKRLNLLKENTFWSFIVFYLFVWKLQPHLEFIYVFNNLAYNLIIIGGVLFCILCGQIFFSLYSFKVIKWGIISLFSILGIFITILFLISVELHPFRLSNYTARMVNNYASINILKDNFFFGVGIGDVQNNLEIVYREIGFRKIQFNEHNQYFRFWLGSGIISIIVYIIWIVKIFLNSILQKDTLKMSVIIILLLFCFTESVFARQMGITFFLFFIFFFIHSKKNIKQNN